MKLYKILTNERNSCPMSVGLLERREANAARFLAILTVRALS